jgi:hypothetical protein
VAKVPVHREPSRPDVPIVGSPGFYRLENGRTRVALEISAKVDIVERRGDAQLVFLIRGAEVVEPVNSLPLRTEYFSTPVARIQLLQVGPDAELLVDLRQAVEDTREVVDTPRGILLRIDFPTYTGAPVSAAVAPVPGRSADTERPRKRFHERASAQPGATRFRPSPETN